MRFEVKLFLDTPGVGGGGRDVSWFARPAAVADAASVETPAPADAEAAEAPKMAADAGAPVAQTPGAPMAAALPDALSAVSKARLDQISKLPSAQARVDKYTALVGQTSDAHVLQTAYTHALVDAKATGNPATLANLQQMISNDPRLAASTQAKLLGTATPASHVAVSPAAPAADATPAPNFRSLFAAAQTAAGNPKGAEAFKAAMLGAVNACRPDHPEDFEAVRQKLGDFRAQNDVLVRTDNRVLDVVLQHLPHEDTAGQVLPTYADHNGGELEAYKHTPAGGELEAYKHTQTGGVLPTY